jgi:HK97 family phage portal protein
MNWWPFSRKSVANAYDVLRELLGRSESASGKIVNASTAAEVSAVYGCLRVLGEDVGQVPLKLMRLDGKKRIEAVEHPLFDLLANSPNGWQTSFEYREMLVWHVGLCGNSYSFINRGVRGSILELIPFTPGSVNARRAEDHTLTYQVTGPNGGVQTFPAEAIWHVKGPSWNSWIGLEAVKLAREAIGLSMATEEQQARLQKNAARPSGLYSVEGSLSPEQYKTLRAWIDSEYGGASNAGRTMVLDRKATFSATAQTGIDAETLATRRMQIEEICRYFRVNPIMVGAESKNATYASAEQMFLAHLVHTLAPWFSRIEQSIDANLLTEKDRAAGLYSNFVEEGLLRGSAVTTKDVILGYVNGGLMTPNEGRGKLDMNPDENPDSDKLRIPANLVGKIEPATEPVKAPA